MNKIIFFDTETTGNTEDSIMIQIAYKHEDISFTGLYNPIVKIPPEASAVHHITNKMVADKPMFKDSDDHTKIKNLFEDPSSILVAHNAPFDLAIIKKENIEPKRFICTLRLVRHLDPEEKIEKYNLQYLRYLLGIEVEATAHDALGDVMVLEKLFDRLKKKVIETEKITEDQALEKMIDISSRPSLFRTFKFGKYNGQKIEDVAKTDRGYLEWLLTQKQNGDTIEEDWIYTLKHFLEK
jgi:DNA polymerase III epsilon subunit-like protein